MFGQEAKVTFCSQPGREFEKERVRSMNAVESAKIVDWLEGQMGPRNEKGKGTIMKKFSRLRSLAVVPLLIAGGLTVGAQPAQADTQPAQPATLCGYGNLDLLVVWNDRTTACADININDVNSKDYSAQYYWAEYLSSGTWRASAVGKKYLTDGTYPNWVVIATNMAVNTPERMRGDHGAYVGTYT